ncbi:GTP-binding protein [Microbacterium aurantiacum]|uniref:GTP-binding protein n=1 Tax=Microbacterium aurantiacum TaxID=162393 RepID=UPI000C801E2A|nr:GTP-binding protein [Microbacterium aurantiacum]
MEHRDPLVVVGVCAPERRRYAASLASATNGYLILLAERPPSQREEGLQLSTAPPLAAATPPRIVADVSADLDLPHLGLAADPRSTVICVVDAVHMLDDLHDGRPLIDVVAEGDDRGDFGARARRAVSLLEGATLIILVNWETVATADLALLMTIASHLNPTARVRLSREAAEDIRSLSSAQQEPAPLLERAGWVHALNDEHDPYMTDPRVTTLRYEQQRPFHPARLSAALNDIDAGAYGTVLRSAGFCRLATRPGILARWDHVGSAIWIDPLSSDIETATTAQDISLTGLNLDPGGLRRALDVAALTDDELTAGPAAWRRFADPLPAWPLIVEESP